MNGEGSIKTDSRGRGACAFLRRKQWWSFEGFDPAKDIYFVFLAMKMFPMDFVSLTVIDVAKGHRIACEYMGEVKALSGNSVNVSARAKWGRVDFMGGAEEGWRIDVETDGIAAHVFQKSQSGMHRNNLLTNRIDYTILQSVHNETSGEISFLGNTIGIGGYGYYEHAWGIQARRSVANWLHFWSDAASGIVMDCSYDAGVPHHYTYLWTPEDSGYLFSPALFSFDPRKTEEKWAISSPDLRFDITPNHTHQTRKIIPPVISYFDIDYTEQLVRIKGEAVLNGKTVEINGLGKYDFNINKW